MKKILVILGLCIVLFSSCSKEVLYGSCNCGLVVNDNSLNYSVVIRNNCSGNDKVFYLQRGDWMNALVGRDYCITNISKW